VHDRDRHRGGEVICRQCIELKRQIAELQMMVGSTDDRPIWALRRAYKLTANEASVLLKLYRGKGSTVRENTLHNARLVERNVGKEQDWPVVKVLICKLRKKLGKSMILNDWGVGYALSPEGMRLVQEALDQKEGAAPPTT
jgi:DNA-binding response OmpR family regulator